MTIRQPDWDRIREALRQADTLSASGELNYEIWKSLILDIQEACVGAIQQGDLMARYARPGWLDRLTAERAATEAA